MKPCTTRRFERVDPKQDQYDGEPLGAEMALYPRLDGYYHGMEPEVSRQRKTRRKRPDLVLVFVIQSKTLTG